MGRLPFRARSEAMTAAGSLTEVVFRGATSVLAARQGAGVRAGQEERLCPRILSVRDE